MAPQLLSLEPHVMLDLMPAFEKHGLDLDLKCVIDAHIPGLRRDLLPEVGRKSEYAVQLGRLEFILAPLGGRPLDHVEGLCHDVSADIHVIIKVQVDAYPDQILQLMLLIEVLHVKLPGHRLSCLDP